MPRFLQSPDVHVLITDRQSAVVTVLDRLATERNAFFELFGPARFQGRVSANNPEINILHDDNFTPFGGYENDYPFLHDGVRLLYLLREEDPVAADPYVCRFAGVVQQMLDSADTEFPSSGFTALDPWHLLDARPCVREILSGTTFITQIVPPNGVIRFTADGVLTYSDIALDLLRRTIEVHGSVGIDAGTLWGGTSFFGGTLTVTEPITEDLVISRGTMVGEVWRQLCETNKIGIILRPIYDPVNRPGYMAEVDIDDSNAFINFQTVFPVFAWDGGGHDVTEIERSTDGTERANKINFYSANGVPAGLTTETPSVIRFGQYWAIEELPRNRNDAFQVQYTVKIRSLRAQGRRTWTIAPNPEWSYRPFQDFHIGLLADVYHSERLRQEMSGGGLIQAFSIQFPDAGTERVSGMLMSPDY